MASKPGVKVRPSGRAWRKPVYWPGGARRRGGVSLVCCSCMEREKAGVDTAIRMTKIARGSMPRRKPKALSTDATHADGPVRSS